MTNTKPAGNRGKGRPKGAKNKLTVAAKEAFAMAFNGAGGVTALTEWAKLNRTEFYRLYARLIPVDVTSGGEKIEPQKITIGGQEITF